MKRTLTPTADAELETIAVDGCSFLVRAGTHDPMIVEEHFKRRRSYARRLQLQPDDVVLDVGAHIGTFTVLAARQVASVVALEPDPGNFELLGRNIIGNGLRNVTARQRALVGNDDVMRALYVSPAGRTSASSFHVKVGRQPVSVFAENVNDVLRSVRPTVVKMDCEGAEAEIVPAIEDWSGIRELALEYHVSMLRDAGLVRYFELLALLEQHFPRVDAHRHHSGAWTRDIYACR